VWLSGWLQSLTYSEVKYRPALVVPGWVTLRVFGIDLRSTYIVHLPQPTPKKPLITKKNIRINVGIINDQNFTGLKIYTREILPIKIEVTLILV